MPAGRRQACPHTGHAHQAHAQAREGRPFEGEDMITVAAFDPTAEPTMGDPLTDLPLA